MAPGIIGAPAQRNRDHADDRPDSEFVEWRTGDANAGALWLAASYTPASVSASSLVRVYLWRSRLPTHPVSFFTQSCTEKQL